jgi:hypothetical protein
MVQYVLDVLKQRGMIVNGVFVTLYKKTLIERYKHMAMTDIVSGKSDNSSLKDRVQEDVDGKTKEMIEKVKAALLVWKAKNAGKVPEFEDILDMLVPKQAGDEEQYDPDEPRILHYHDPIMNAFFGTQEKQWTMQKPPMVDQLNQRDINGEDLFHGILHGVLDDADYNSLDQQGLLDDRCKQLWERLSSLRQNAQQMEKSLEDAEPIENEGKEEIAEEEGEEKNEQTAPKPQPTSNESGEEGELKGTNLIEQIIAGATGASTNNSFNAESIRSIVREEIRNYLGGAH